MGVVRIAPNLPVSDVGRAIALYAELFALEARTDMGWVGFVGPHDRPGVQLQVITSDKTAACDPAVSIAVPTASEVDDVYKRVTAAGLDVVHAPTHEPWGVYRFFFRDPDGNVVNVVAHRES